MVGRVRLDLPTSLVALTGGGPRRSQLFVGAEIGNVWPAGLSRLCTGVLRASRSVEVTVGDEVIARGTQRTAFPFVGLWPTGANQVTTER